MSSCYVVQVVPGSEQITSERELLVQLILLHGNINEHHKWFLFTSFFFLSRNVAATAWKSHPGKGATRSGPRQHFVTRSGK